MMDETSSQTVHVFVFNIVPLYFTIKTSFKRRTMCDPMSFMSGHCLITNIVINTKRTVVKTRNLQRIRKFIDINWWCFVYVCCIECTWNKWKTIRKIQPTLFSKMALWFQQRSPPIIKLLVTQSILHLLI